MSNELDANKIAVQLLQKNIGNISEIIKKLGKSAADHVRLRLDSTYKDYITTILERHSKVKCSFLYKK